MAPPEPFRSAYLDICRTGFQALGRTQAKGKLFSGNEWHFQAGRPPSYSAFGRYRFLKTLEIARRYPFQTAFEVAAGDGFLSACLWEEGRKIVVNDLRPIGSQLEQWVGGDRLEVVVKNFLEVEPRLFDFVIACEVIEHVADGPAFVEHLRKFVKPGGRLLLTTPNGAYFRSKLPTFSQIQDFSELEARQFKPDADGHLYLYTRKELEGMLEGGGFKKFEIEAQITPWISGHAQFRLLPKSDWLTSKYYDLDQRTRVAERFCSQLFATAWG